MRLLWRVAHQELRHAWRTRSVAVLSALLTLLLVVAASTAHERRVQEATQRMRYQNLVGSQFASQPDRHPHRVSHYGYLLFRPPAPLGAFDSGVERFAGTSLFLEAHRQNTANFSAASQGGTERFGDLSPAAVLQLFVPLFLLVTAGVSVSREREGGTLALLLAQGVRWRMIVGAKALGAWLLAVGVTTPGLLACVWVVTREVPARDSVPRLALLALLHLVFWALIAAVGALVSARARSSREALVIALGAWITLWVIVPRVAAVVALSWVPLPSQAEFAERLDRSVRALGDAHNPEDPAFARLQRETLNTYGVATVAELPFNYQGLVMEEGERHTAEAFEAHLDTLAGLRARQQAILDAISVVSPYLAMRTVSMTIAGTDMLHLASFERQAESYRYALIQGLNRLHKESVSAAQDRYGAVVNGAPSRQRIDRRSFEALPKFVYRAPSLAGVLAERRSAVLVLLLMIGAIGAVFVGMTRDDRAAP